MRRLFPHDVRRFSLSLLGHPYQVICPVNDSPIACENRCGRVEILPSYVNVHGRVLKKEGGIGEKVSNPCHPAINGETFLFSFFLGLARSLPGSLGSPDRFFSLPVESTSPAKLFDSAKYKPIRFPDGRTVIGPGSMFFSKGTLCEQ